MIINAIGNVSIKRFITNDENVTVAGTTAAIDTTYGVKVGYCSNGDVIISTKAPSTGRYYVSKYQLVSAPDGVTIKTVTPTASYVQYTNYMDCCVISGLKKEAVLGVNISTSYSNTTIKITLTEGA